MQFASMQWMPVDLPVRVFWSASPFATSFHGNFWADIFLRHPQSITVLFQGLQAISNISRRFLVIHVVFHVACRGAVLQEELSEESEEPPAVAGPATPAATTPAATPAASPTGTGAVGALRGLGGLVAAAAHSAAHSAAHAVESAAHATEMLLGETHVAATHKKEQEHAHHESALPNSFGFLGCRCVWIACRESDENWPARFRSMMQWEVLVVDAFSFFRAA